jgi:hypothetical protein
MLITSLSLLPLVLLQVFEQVQPDLLTSAELVACTCPTHRKACRMLCQCPFLSLLPLAVLQVFEQVQPDLLTSAELVACTCSTRPEACSTTC